MRVSLLDQPLSFQRVLSPLEARGAKVRVRMTFTAGPGTALWCKKRSMTVAELAEVRTLRDIFLLFPRLHDAICQLALPPFARCGMWFKARGVRYAVSGFFHEFLCFDSTVIF